MLLDRQNINIFLLYEDKSLFRFILDFFFFRRGLSARGEGVRKTTVTFDQNPIIKFDQTRWKNLNRTLCSPINFYKQTDFMAVNAE